jgi:hypothetical protein
MKALMPSVLPLLFILVGATASATADEDAPSDSVLAQRAIQTAWPEFERFGRLNLEKYDVRVHLGGEQLVVIFHDAAVPPPPGQRGSGDSNLSVVVELDDDASHVTKAYICCR